MKKTSSAFLAFILAIVLALLLAGSALAVPPRDGSRGIKDPDRPNPLGVRELQKRIAPATRSPAAGMGSPRAPDWITS